MFKPFENSLRKKQKKVKFLIFLISDHKVERLRGTHTHTHDARTVRKVEKTFYFIKKVRFQFLKF